MNPEFQSLLKSKSSNLSSFSTHPSNIFLFQSSLNFDITKQSQTGQGSKSATTKEPALPMEPNIPYQIVSLQEVKQKKKSSNKWTCVVCNQKQSVRKVFAQGYNAKDLRQYVQSFNMSLKDRPHEEQQEEEEVRDMEAKESQQSRAKNDSKWKDYLSEDDEEPRTSQPTMNNALLLNGEITRLKMT
ncbi:hypothetical protein Q3G72_012837 [Acer saccharum]|nr:hypothetical protein Q3G72_012837 [Acer saccharum]